MFKKILILFSSLILSFIIFEALVRIYSMVVVDYDIEMWKYRNFLMNSVSDARGHIQKSSIDINLMGVHVKTNSLGLRDNEVAIENAKGIKRVAIVGDSFTFGWGVEQNSRFSDIIQNEFSEKSLLEVINFGHVNYNTRQQRELLTRTVLPFNPEIVLLAFYINDAEPTQKTNYGFLESFLMSPIFLMSRLRRVLSAFGSSIHFEEYYSNLYQGEGWLAYQAELEKVHKIVGGALSVVLLPELRATNSDVIPRIYSEVEAYWKNKGVPVLNLQGRLGGGDLQRYWVAPDDPHPNEKANKVFGAEIIKFIRNNGALN